MALAIINTSGTRISLPSFVLAPGAKVALSSHYGSEEEANHDLQLKQLRNAGKIRICDVDSESTTALQATIDRLEKRDADAMAAVKLISREQRRQRIEARRQQAEEYRVSRQTVRQQDQREADVPEQGIDLSALYETTRKERLARAKKSKSEQQR